MDKRTIKVSMKRLQVLVIVLFLLPFLSKAQINHYISYNTYVYGNFFNKEIDRVYMSQSIRIPIGSYKVEKGNWGAEFFLIIKTNIIMP